MPLVLADLLMVRLSYVVQLLLLLCFCATLALVEC